MRPLNFTQNDMCATSDKNTNFNISKNLLCKVGILNSVRTIEQFSSLFSKDKIKARGTHKPAHDPPSPRMSWENYRAVPSQLMRNRGSLRHRLSPLINPMIMPRAMALHMRGLCMYSPCWHYFHCNFRLGNRINFNLFFINHCNSWHF